MRAFSSQGRFIFLMVFVVVVSNSVAITAALYFHAWWLTVVLATMATTVVIIAVVRSYFRPMEDILAALRSGVASFKDHDYSVNVARTRDDDLGELVTAYNELAATLRDERFNLFQRELLLDTVIQSSSVAVVIVNLRGVIVFSNRVARGLFCRRESLEGRALLPLCEARSAALTEQTRQRRDGLFTIEGNNGERDVYHLTSRQFNLNGQFHQLYLYKQLTREIARQEVETWKKVIRVISHELNNSLAPISSLTNSARLILERGDNLERMDDIFTSIAHRSDHLHRFIEQYARFARLPKPRPQAVNWAEFVAHLKVIIRFELETELPDSCGTFDPTQIEQVLINLLKNAKESGSPTQDIQLRILQDDESSLIAVEDRGPGMNGVEIAQALLPFYSTKRKGSGLGLPLCREILEAHGGHFRLVSRTDGGLAAICKLPLIKEFIEAHNDAVEDPAAGRASLAGR